MKDKSTKFAILSLLIFLVLAAAVGYVYYISQQNSTYDEAGE